MSIYIDKIRSLAEQNKYTKWYCSIIAMAMSRVDQSKTKHTQRKQAKTLFGSIEGHHILPKCMCDDEPQKNDKHNFAYLTPREHVVVHILLTKMFSGDANKKMAWAAHRMLTRCTNSRMYDYIKKNLYKELSEKIYSLEERNSRAERTKANWDGNDERRTKASILFSHFRKTGVVNTKTEFSDDDRKMFSALAKADWEGNEERRKKTAELSKKYHEENPNMSRNTMNRLHENGTMAIAYENYWTEETRKVRSEQAKSRWDDHDWKESQLQKRAYRIENKETILYAFFDMIVVEFKTMKAARDFIIAPRTGTFSKLVKETKSGCEFTHKGVLFYKT